MEAIRQTLPDLYATNKISCVNYTLSKLPQLSIDTIFMVPGKMIQPFMQGLSTYKDQIKSIVATHETGAGFMAEGYARVSENFGVCFSSAGPGTYNLAPAIASAYADEIPVLAISGTPPSYVKGCSAFQDSTSSGVNNIASLTPITHTATEVTDAFSLPVLLKHSINAMYGEKPGPSYLEIPMNIQQKSISSNESFIDIQYCSNSIDPNQLDRISQILSQQQEKTVVLVGSRARNTRSHHALLSLCAYYQLPVATTLCSKGVFPEDHDLALGVFGFAGNNAAHKVILGNDIDNLILIGVDINQRNSLSWSADMLPRNKLVCIGPHQNNNHFSPDISAVNHCAPALEYLADNTIELQPAPKKKQWINDLRDTTRYYDLCSILNELNPIHPGRVIAELRLTMPRDSILAVDSGIHQVFAAHYWEAYYPNTYLTSASMAPMGWAIGAIIGAQLAKPNQRCVTVTDDECMLMHGNEIQTAARYQLPIIYVVLKNCAHGDINKKANNENGFSAGLTTLPQHHWQQYAESLGLTGYRITKNSELSNTFQQALELNKPCLIEVHVGSNYKTPNDDYQKRQARFDRMIQQ